MDTSLNVRESSRDKPARAQLRQGSWAGAHIRRSDPIRAQVTAHRTVQVAVKRVTSLLLVLVACGEANLGQEPRVDAAEDDLLDGASGHGGQGPASGEMLPEDDAIPRFSTAFYFDLAQVQRISRFRSGVGHDYGDYYESCRSMKHYVCPTHCLDSNFPPPGSHDPPWTELEIRSPFAGTVLRLDAEHTFGTQLILQPADHPDIRVKIFHVTPASDIVAGAAIVAGQRLGTHASDLTMSDIAVEQDRAGGLRRLSFFETLTDAAFAPLVARGIDSRAALQITAAERDLAPLSCDGEVFLSEGTIANWIELE